MKANQVIDSKTDIRRVDVMLCCIFVSAVFIIYFGGKYKEWSLVACANTRRWWERERKRWINTQHCLQCRCIYFDYNSCEMNAFNKFLAKSKYESKAKAKVKTWQEYCENLSLVSTKSCYTICTHQHICTKKISTKKKSAERTNFSIEIVIICLSIMATTSGHMHVVRISLSFCCCFCVYCLSTRKNSVRRFSSRLQSIQIVFSF